MKVYGGVVYMLNGDRIRRIVASPSLAKASRLTDIHPNSLTETHIKAETKLCLRSPEEVFEKTIHSVYHVKTPILQDEKRW